MTNKLAVALALAVVCAPLAAAADGGLNGEGPPPTTGIDQLVDQTINRCIQVNQGVNFGIATPKQWCTIRTWSALGRHYSDLAEKFRTLQADYNEQVGKTNSLRRANDRLTDRNEQLSANNGQLRGQLKASSPKWMMWVAGGIALVAGAGAGFAIGKVAP